MTIKRYGCTAYYAPCGMVENDKGDWVRYEDVQHLEEEIAKAMEYGHKYRLEAALAKKTPPEVLPTKEMIEAGIGVRVNLRFQNQGISGFLSEYEVKEIYGRMVEASLQPQK